MYGSAGAAYSTHCALHLPVCLDLAESFWWLRKDSSKERHKALSCSKLPPVSHQFNNLANLKFKFSSQAEPPGCLKQF